MSQEDYLKSILSPVGSPRPPGASRNSFNPLSHQLPQFRTDGQEIEVYNKLNVIAEKDQIRIPSQWNSSANIVKTNKQLQKVRRMERIPDPSFDLNGDGTVSAHEYAISKMFDFDFDGKLNAQEKAF